MWAFAVVGIVAISRVVSSQSAPVPVTGVRTGVDHNTGERPQRLNINDLFSRGGPQWDLYVQALQAFQDVNETEELSYFQIAGIHGYPVGSWNGVDQVPGGANLGYCPHAEILFASWHRPFVALFEQELVRHAARIAKTYPQKVSPTYQAAAQTLRQPYWDWASNQELPPAAVPSSLTIIIPHGPANVSNPLASYRFQSPPNYRGFDGALSHYSETVRCPSQAGTDSDAAASNYQLTRPGLALAAKTYRVFTQSQSYDQMATIASVGPSFEDPHNSVHNAAGCENGTLFNIGWSAFDPLFWLHHANVDRLIAMWQAIHYNATALTVSGIAHGTFGTAEGTIIDIDTPLKPFLAPDLTPYTTRTAVNTKTFGYTYPEIKDWQITPEELASYVIARVNDLYGQGVEGQGTTTTTTTASSKGPKSQSKAVAAATQLGVSYSAEIKVDRANIQLPATIDLVLDDHLLGQMTLLGMPMSGVSYSSIPLTDVFQGLNLGGMTEDTLVPYLQRHLEVRVRTGNGTVLSKRSAQAIPSLGVELQVQDFVPRTRDTELPRYGVATRWPIAKHV